jgi:exonuclease VII large subunit
MARLELHDLDKTSAQLEETFANVFTTLLEMIGCSIKAIARRRWKEYIARLLHGEDQKIVHLRKRLKRLVQDGTSLIMEHIHSNVKSIANHTATTAMAVDDIQAKTNAIGADITDLKGDSRFIMDLLQEQHQSQCDNDIYKTLRPSQPNTVERAFMAKGSLFQRSWSSRKLEQSLKQTILLKLFLSSFRSTRS